MVTWYIYFFLLMLSVLVLRSKALSPIQGSSAFATSLSWILFIIGILALVVQFIMAFWHIKWWIVLLVGGVSYFSLDWITVLFTGLLTSKDSSFADFLKLMFVLLSIAGIVVFGMLSFKALLQLP